MQDTRKEGIRSPECSVSDGVQEEWIGEEEEGLWYAGLSDLWSFLA
jgi:hypothetical protein